MLELRTKAISTWALYVNGERIPFNIKKNAISIGKRLCQLENNKVTLFEEYKLWDISKRPSILLDRQSFDRTILIQ